MLFIRRLIWNDGNMAHITSHDVTPEEVEAVCQSNPVVQEGKKGRLLVFGPTQAGKMLTVVLDPEEEKGMYYVVTARPASRRERDIYTQEKEVEKR